MKACGPVLGALLVACADGAPLGATGLVALRVDGAELTPPFSPDTAEYRAEVGLLSERVSFIATLHGEGEFHAVDQRGTSRSGVRGEGDQVVAGGPLELGANDFDLVLGDARYTIRVTRHPEPWRAVQVLADDPPVENAYFGDYLRASERFLYVNASRRGRLYRKQQGAWVFDRASEDLVSRPLEWMYEAALSHDTLAFVAQPEGGEETLYAFSIDADGRFAPAGKHVTSDQGTLRLAYQELAFVTEDRVEVLRPTGGTWSLAQTIPAPAPGIGFAQRPTYFDAPGVAFDGYVLAVGAPLAEECGAVLAYERDASGVYAGPTVLKPDAPVSGLEFGHATALSGDFLAVGVPHDGAGPGGPESGAVFVFRRTTEGWIRAGTLRQSVARPYDYFGDSLVMRGDVLLVGAPGQDSAFGAALEDESATDTGGVFAFVREGEAFRELGLQKLPPDETAPFPFPQALGLAGTGLTTASNTAPVVLSDGTPLENAGRAYFLSW